MQTVSSSQQLVQCLRQTPQAFPHPAGQVQCIETHISWVLLAGEFAYKLKKPVQMDVLDFRTLAQRHAACLEELRINRRTAPDLYLAVLPVCGCVQAPRIGGSGPVLDWVVQMRRFDQAGLFSDLIAKDRLWPKHIDDLARQVAAFHECADRAPGDSAFAQPAAQCEWVRQNLESLHAMVGADPPGLVEALVRWSEAESQALAPLLAQRLNEGWVRECHGDLHLGNLVLIDGKPQLFDAIEFNPALRWIDVLADVAFLFMDLQSHGRADLAWRFLNAYLERTGDYAGLRVLPYHLSYRAAVRAKVAALRLAQSQVQGRVERQGNGQEEDSGPQGAALRQDVARYLQRACRYTQLRAPWLWITCGVSGSGKSSQTQSLIEARGMVRLRSDVERKRMFGLQPEASSEGLSGIYTPDATHRTYAQLAAQARAVLQAGLPVLVDATFLRRRERDDFRVLARSLGLPFRVLAFDAPEALLRERIRQRAEAGGDASEATQAVLSAQLAQREPLAPDELLQAVRIEALAPVDWSTLLPMTTCSHL